MGQITNEILTGGLSRTSPNYDKYSGIVMKVNTLPKSWAEGDVARFTSASKHDDVIVQSVLDEYFRMNPDGVLYLCLTAVAFNVDLLDNILARDKKVRLLAYISDPVVGFKEFGDNVKALQVKLKALKDTKKRYVRGVYGQNGFLKGKKGDGTDVDDITVAKQLTGNDRVFPFISTFEQKGYLATINFVGTIARTPVHQKVSWVGKNNVSSTIVAEDKIKFINKNVGVETEVSEVTIKELLNKGFNFFRTYDKFGGVYHAGFVTGTEPKNEFHPAQFTRVIDKASTVSEIAISPYMDSVIYTQSGGIIGKPNAKRFEGIIIQALQTNMMNGKLKDDVELTPETEDGQLGEDTVQIDPNHRILDDETMTILMQLRPVGATKNFAFKIGLTTK